MERIAQLIASVASEKGYEVEVVTNSFIKDVAVDAQFNFKITRTGSFVDRVCAFKRADLVLFMGVSLHGMLAAWFAQTKVVFSHHGTYYGAGIFSGFVPYIKRLSTRFYPNISCSGYVAGSIPGKSVVIPNAYDDTLFIQSSTVVKTSDFVYCGRMVSYKRPEDCLKAFFKVLILVPDATLTFIGDGSQRASLEKIVIDHDLSDRVHFTGSLVGKALVEVLQQQVCMLVPSIGEAFGIVALEGIACCDTVVVYNSGGLPEAVSGCGLVIEPNVQSLYEAMLAVAQAFRKGVPLPGEPDIHTRVAYLAQHSSVKVAEKYLRFMENPPIYC